MRKQFSLLLMCISLLSAESINFNNAKTELKRLNPVASNTIYSYHDVLKGVTPSVVHIATTQNSPQNIQMQEFFQDFFGRRYAPQAPQKRKGLGSGVIVSEDGYIVTNNHVIEHADEITVTLPQSSKTYEAKLVGTDPKSDIALIKIEVKEKLPSIYLGDSSELEVGDLVFAIGNPFGVGQSVTQGIISAQHKNTIGINEYENFIQTDASINPGNSGGALVDSRGALIGINTAILSRSGGNNGIGFAIEVNMLKDVLPRLMEDGKVKRAYLGVQIGNLEENLKGLYTQERGALVIDVTPGSAALEAGLMRGDLITKVGKTEIKNASDLKNAIGRLKPGTKVKIEYERSKKRDTVMVALQPNLSDSLGESVFAGLKLVELDDKLRYQYRIARDVRGVMVQGVDKNSEALGQGIRVGDIIIQVEENDISSIKDLQKVLNAYKNEYKRVYINRDGRIYLIALK